MKLKGIHAKGYDIDSKGKMVKKRKKLAVSEHIRQRTSKRVKVAR